MRAPSSNSIRLASDVREHVPSPAVASTLTNFALYQAGREVLVLGSGAEECYSTSTVQVTSAAVEHEYS